MFKLEYEIFGKKLSITKSFSSREKLEQELAGFVEAASALGAFDNPAPDFSPYNSIDLNSFVLRPYHYGDSVDQIHIGPLGEDVSSTEHKDV